MHGCSVISCPPMTSTPKKGVTTSMVEEADTFEILEETETEAKESTICWEITVSEDNKQVPLEKQLTFLVFELALMLLFATFPSSNMLLDLF